VALCKQSGAAVGAGRFRFQRPAGRKARGSVHKVEESNILNDTRLIIIIFVEI